MRQKIAAGNWKMHKTLAEALSLASDLDAAWQPQHDQVQMVLCVPALYLLPVKKIVRDNGHITLGAQNCAQYAEGAYTGEISPRQLASAEIPYVILGHSERRTLFGETDEVLHAKVKAALAEGLKPIFCCGEPIEVRQANQQDSFVRNQIEAALFALSDSEMQQIVIAYEPIWAIGTGLTASSAQAQEMHAFIRGLLAGRFGSEMADRIPILYGGSVKSSNAREIFSMPDVDGGLVGGASLQAAEFIAIAQCF